MADSYGITANDDARSLRKIDDLSPLIRLVEPSSTMVRSQILDNLRVEELVGSINKANMINEIARNLKSSQVNVHISLDSGQLGRDGFSVSSDANIKKSIRDIESISRLSHIKIVGVCSHFSSPESESTTELNKTAMRFIEVSRKIQQQLAINQKQIPRLHMAASEAALKISNEVKAQFDFIRVGRMLYGLLPQNSLGSKITIPVMLIFCQKLGQHYRDRGDSIGYCKTYTCKKRELIKTLSLGWSMLPPGLLPELDIYNSKGKLHKVCGYGAMNAIMTKSIDEEESQESHEKELFLVSGRSTVSLTLLAQRSGYVPPTLTIMAGNNIRTGRILLE